MLTKVKILSLCFHSVSSERLRTVRFCSMSCSHDIPKPITPPPPFFFYPFLKILLFQVKYTDLLDHKGCFSGARNRDDCKHDLTENTEAVWFLSTERWYLCGKHKKIKRLFQEKIRSSEYLKASLLFSFFSSKGIIQYHIT